MFPFIKVRIQISSLVLDESNFSLSQPKIAGVTCLLDIHSDETANQWGVATLNIVVYIYAYLVIVPLINNSEHFVVSVIQSFASLYLIFLHNIIVHGPVFLWVSLLNLLHAKIREFWLLMKETNKQKYERARIKEWGRVVRELIRSYFKKRDWPHNTLHKTLRIRWVSQLVNKAKTRQTIRNYIYDSKLNHVWYHWSILSIEEEKAFKERDQLYNYGCRPIWLWEIHFH